MASGKFLVEFDPSQGCKQAAKLLTNGVGTLRGVAVGTIVLKGLGFAVLLAIVVGGEFVVDEVVGLNAMKPARKVPVAKTIIAVRGFFFNR